MGDVDVGMERQDAVQQQKLQQQGQQQPPGPDASALLKLPFEELIQQLRYSHLYIL